MNSDHSSPEDTGTMESGNSPGRRKLLLIFWFAAQGIIAALFAIPGIRYVLQPLYEEVQSKRIQLGDFRAVPEGEPTRVEYSVLRRAGYEVEEQNKFVYVLRRDDEVTVYSPVCTHMGCNVAWNANESEFQCPCHGGRFNMDGKVVGGPPPKPLQELASEIEEGTLWITREEDKV